jgi:hypothetical protein
MKALRRFCQWFVSGVAFAAGAAIVIWVVDKLRESPPVPDYVDTRVELPRDSVTISQVEPIGFAENLTLSAQATNGNAQPGDAQMDISLMKGQQVLYRCSDVVRVESGASRIQVECPQIKSNALPSDLLYQVAVRKVLASK